MDNQKIIEFDINGNKYWMDYSQYEYEQKFMAAQEELFSIKFWLHKEITNEVIAEVYKRYGLTYTPPDSFKLDYYFIITDKGLMVRDRKGFGDYQVLEGYNIADKPYEGEYKYIRDARPMDI